MSEQLAVYQIGNILRMYPVNPLKLDGEPVSRYINALPDRQNTRLATVVPIKPSCMDVVVEAGCSSESSYSQNDQDAAPKLYIEVTAYHEAGHALAAVYEGRHVTGVAISMNEPGNGICRHAWLPPNPYDVTLSPGNARAAWEHTVKNTLADMRILLAGPLAEAKLLGQPMRSLGSISDFEKCIGKANKLKTLSEFISDITPVEPINPERLLEEQRKKTRRWLMQSRVWASIKMAAKVLVLDGTLNARQLGIIIAAQSLQQQQLPFYFLETPFKK